MVQFWEYLPVLVAWSHSQKGVSLAGALVALWPLAYLKSVIGRASKHRNTRPSFFFCLCSLITNRAPENFLSKKKSSTIFSSKKIRPKFFRPILFRPSVRPKNFRRIFFSTTKTKRLVNGRACAHRPNAINERLFDFAETIVRTPY